jgi:tetratricopeptide (TPR) repeat protein
MAIDKNTISKEAQKFVAKGQYDKAIAEWKKLLKVTPDDPNIFNIIGDLCLKKNAKVGAVEAYRKAADLLAADGFTSKAIALYKKVLNIDIKQIEVHLALGDMNVEKGLIGNALENYKYVADHYTHNNETAKALTIYQKMADLNASNAAFRVKLGDMYAKEEMKEDAANAYLAAADVHVSKNAFKEARQLFEKVLALNTSSKEVYHKAGVVYFLEGKFSEACKALKPAFEDDPSNKELASSYVEALDKAGRNVEVEQVIRTHLAEAPDDDAFREKLYRLYLAQKDYDKAIVEAAILADAKITNGDTGAAEEIYRAFVTGCPDYPPGRQKLAEFYLAVNRPQDAAAELIQTAESFVNEGDVESARAVLTQVIEIAPELSAAREQLERLQTPATTGTSQALEFLTAREKPELNTPEADASGAEPLPVPESPVHAPPVDAAPISADEAPAIDEAFIEADVLIKYGLAAKAIEQLDALTSKFPESPRIRTRLRDLYHEQGNIDKAVRQALLAVALYTKYGKDDEASAVLQAARDLAPDHPAILSKLGRMAVAPAAEESIGTVPDENLPQEILQDEIEAPVTSPEPFPAFPEEHPVESMAPQEPTGTDEIKFEEPGEVPIVSEADESANIAHEEFLPQEILQDDIEGPVTSPEPFPAFPEEHPVESIAPQEPTRTDEIAFEELDTEIPPLEEISSEESASVADPSVFVQQPIEEAPPFPELYSMEPPSVGEEPAGELEQADIGPAEEVAVPEPPAEIDLDEIWAETEFYFQQGLFDEAKKQYTRILALTPGDQKAIDRLSEIAREENETREFAKLTDAVEGLEGYVPPEATDKALAASPSDDEAVRSLMQEIQQLKQQPTSPQPPSRDDAAGRPFEQAKKTAEEDVHALVEEFQQRKQHTTEPDASPQEITVSTPEAPTEDISRPFEPGNKTTEEDFFDLGEELQRETASPVARQVGKDSGDTSEKEVQDATEDFFDLAAELRDELNSVTVPVRPAAPAEEQSLDDIFEEFKKGVEQQSAKEDADTHYNLGVAYKEMGLLDDAVGELTLTTEVEPKYIQSRYMLGLCYMEKGEYQKAINEIQTALAYSESLEIDTDNRIAMHYDLGLAFQGAGNIDSAINEFQMVINENPEYRDTAAKLKELRKGDFISLEQLKDDIEKEISSKFLEEGERIEREEKTKKNERVRN